MLLTEPFAFKDLLKDFIAVHHTFMALPKQSLALLKDHVLFLSVKLPVLRLH